MRFLFFVRSITSGWRNGHAPIYRGLARALVALGHDVDFVERDDPARALARDLAPAFDQIHVYSDWADFRPDAGALLSLADVTIVGSRLEDGLAICDYVLEEAPARTVFYDLDLPLTLDDLDATGAAPYVAAEHIPRFDLVCANALGTPLATLVERYGARRAVGLLPAHDPGIDRPLAAPRAEFRSTLSFLGAYEPARAAPLETFLFEPARRRPGGFVVAGGGFADGPLPAGVTYFPHIAPRDQAEFFSAAECVLAVARGALLDGGACPPARLFEAAGAGACVLASPFPGLESLFRVGEEVLLVRDTADVLAALDLDPVQRRAIGLRARYRALRDHTYARRALEFLDYLGAISS
jgi:spore maturation protein CgeB